MTDRAADVSADAPDRTVVFTDGACKGNPGPGGWAWAVVDGAWCSGYEPATTNQRMEITAAYRAVRDNPGPLLIVSDSTYVVNCFRDRWWEGWIGRGWVNSRKEPVANRDLWEPFVELLRNRDVVFEWVKGHSGHEMNDLVDALAVAAVEARSGDHGPGPLRASDVASAVVGAPPVEAEPPVRAARDRRVPEGHLWTIVGLRDPSLAASRAGAELRAKLAKILAAQQELHGDVVVLSGARPGVERIGALAAADAGVPYVVILPYPDPLAGAPADERADFDQICAGARAVVTLEAKRPRDGQGRAAALARRDGWLRSVSSGAVVVTAEPGRQLSAAASKAAAAAQDQLTRFGKVLGDEVWELSVPL